MANVKGIKEKVHYPLYDSFTIKGLPLTKEGFIRPELTRDTRMSIGRQLKLNSGIMRFFVDVQNKTRLETNMQASGVLPHFNTMEVRAMRVTITGGYNLREFPGGRVNQDASGASTVLAHFAPTPAFTTVMDEVVNGSVTSLFVGEKVMIQHPTWYFPAAGGVTAVPGTEGKADPRADALAFDVPSNGEPTTESTFRFAESVFIEKQQNFRVEVEFPETEVLNFLESAYGPFRVWVTLDGFLTRDVQ